MKVNDLKDILVSELLCVYYKVDIIDFRRIDTGYALLPEYKTDETLFSRYGDKKVVEIDNRFNRVCLKLED